MKKDLPFKEKKIENKSFRTFFENVNNDELKWHRDYEDRIVRVRETTDWMLQLDNQLPVVLETNKDYFIPKGLYHRVIKGTGNLNVEIDLMKL